ncbi:MAG: type IV pilus secretin PilQ [Proteobacteria bacterium]|nr:type IV pilus secretin PilQ [Pseudomonadota bacterium]
MKQGSKAARRLAVMSAAFCICSTAAWDSSQSHSDNSITSLNYSQESTKTLVEIGVEADPTFSVYTLKNPERVVVEILDCASSVRQSPIQVRNGVIDTAAVSVTHANNYSTCRVILGLEQAAAYSVDSTKDRIIVSVDGVPQMNGREYAEAYETMKQSQEAALASARSMVEREQAETARARAEAEAARAEAAQAYDREQAALAQLEKAYREAESRVLAMEALDSAQAELAKAKKDMAALELARNEALERAQTANARLAQIETARVNADSSAAHAHAELEAARAQADALEAEHARQMARMGAELEAANAKVASLESARAAADRNAATTGSELEAARSRMSELESARAQAEALQAEHTRQMARMGAELEAANAKVASLESARAVESQKTNSELSSARARLAELEAARAEASQANAELQNMRARVSELEAGRVRDAARASAELSAAKQRVSELEAMRSTEIARISSELDDANARVAALENARSQDVARKTAELAQAQGRVAELEAERAKARTEAENYARTQSELAARNAELSEQVARRDAQAAENEKQRSMLAAENAELLKRIASQEAEMARLNKEVSAGGAARRKVKQLEAQQQSLTAAQEAQLAELKAQARQGRHALEQLHDIQSENASLRAQLERSQAQLAATTAGRSDQPAVASVATTEARKDMPVIASVATTAPIDDTIGMQQAQNFGAAPKAPIDDHAAAAASVRDIRFRNRPDGDGMEVVLKLSAPVDKVENVDGGSQKSILRIAGAVLPDDFNKKYDTSAFNQGVRFVDSTQAKGGIELIAQSTAKTVDTIEQDGDTITWSIRPLRETGTAYRAMYDRRRSAHLSSAEPAPAALPVSQTSYGAAANLKDTPLAKRKITLDIHDADINDLLRLLSDEINTSIVVSPDVSGNITLSLKSVPLDQALDIIMRMHDLGMRYEGNVIWIAKAEAFRAEEERAAQAAEVRERLEPLEVRLIPVNYALADDLKTNVQSLMSSRGSINIDQRTNTLILKDVAANLDAAEILVSNLDTQTPQILIEARIVETQANFTKEIGIQWGGDGVASAATGNATGIVFPSTIGIAGGSTSDNNMGTSKTPNFAVNLPASVGTGTGGALGVTLGSLGGTINLNLRLSSLEEKGFLKIVSAPRIMTLDNIQASIESGTSIPISVVSAAGAQTVFVDAKLNLQVTPHVTRDGNVYLKINISKNEPDFGNTGASGDPSIIRKEARTELLIPDGDTTVIGGIYSRNTSQSMSSIPFWGSIPILGYLFRNQSETDNRSELLIFITPRIINRDASISASGHGSFIPPVERTEEKEK